MFETIRLGFGDYRVTVLPLGEFSLDGGAMFGVVPKTLWCRCMTPDEENRVLLASSVMLLEYRDEARILVDTGVGDKFSDKARAMYGIQSPQNLFAALESMGLTPESVTHVIYTHLHFDHAGGGTRRLEAESPDSTIVPAFPHAQYLVQHGEWERANNPHERSRASYLVENLDPLGDSGQLQLIDDEIFEMLPGLRLERTGGHTPYHQAVILDVPDDTGRHTGLVHWGDVIPTRHHVRIPYTMGYDEYPIECMEAKRRMLREAAAQNRLCVFEHDPEHPVCSVKPLNQPGARPDQYEVIPWQPALAVS